jgi:flagellar basal-body rod protein FlgC
MKLVYLLFAMVVSASAFAAPAASDACLEIKAEQLRLALTASNVANVRTTRTPEGGPYRPYIIKSCKNGACDVERDVRGPLVKYEPGHPDANQYGYVAYPNLNAKAELAALNLSAAKLKLLAAKKECDTKILENKDSVLIEYSSEKTGVKEDIFNFSKDNNVVSWARTDANGARSTMNFSADGTVSAQ